MVIGPHTQKEHSKITGDRIKLYRILYLPVILAAALMMVLFFVGNAKLNYIQEDYYVYGNYKYKLNPEIEEDIPLFEKFVIDTITPVDTILPVPNVVKQVDLRRHFSSIKNQGRQGSCLAFALSAVMEYTVKVKRAETADFSEAFLYYKAREKAGQQNVDNGSYFVYAIETLQQLGICTERFMPYDEYDYTSSPSQNAYNNALSYKISKANTVNQQLEDLKSALYNGYPIAISAAIFSSFGNGSNDVIPMPSKREVNNYQYGGVAHSYHAMVIVGYDDNRQQFIVRNSWGDNFGDNGYCYMPYDYITDENLTRYACVIKK
jgi:C1A family cysteine protease